MYPLLTPLSDTDADTHRGEPGITGADEGDGTYPHVVQGPGAAVRLGRGP